MKMVERFFASLLMLSSHEDFKNSGKESVRSNILSKTCSFLNLPLPAPLPPVQKDKAEFYNTRAALVMEESRAILCNAISLNSMKKYDATRLLLDLAFVKTLKTGNLQLFFKKSLSTPFSRSELDAMKRGCCCELTPVGYNGCSASSSSSSTSPQLWPIIAPCFLRFSREGQPVTTSVSFMCFQRELFPTIQSMTTGTKFFCQPLTALISQLRQFEVCLRAPNVEFLPSLLGGSLHHGANIRVNTGTASSSASEEENTRKSDELPETIEKALEESSKLEGFQCNSPFNLPTLNPTQQRVVGEFLSSPSSTLKIIQGPPGIRFFFSVYYSRTVLAKNAESWFVLLVTKRSSLLPNDFTAFGEKIHA